MRSLFLHDKGFDENIGKLLEMRLSQMEAVDPDLRKYVERAIQDLRSSPSDAIVWIRSVTNRALDLVWDAELPSEGTLPASWVEEWKHGGEVLPDWRGKPVSREEQCRLLRLMTGTMTSNSVTKHITKPTALLINQLNDIGDFGQVYDSHVELVSPAFAASACFSALALCNSITDDLNRSRTKRVTPLEVMACFMASSRYGPEETYGFYVIPHTGPTEDQVKTCLDRIKIDMKDVEDLLSEDGGIEMNRYVDEAKNALNQGGFKGYRDWLDTKRDSFSDQFRFGFKNWIEFIKRAHGDRVSITIPPICGKPRLINERIYCDRKLIEDGLNTIIDNSLRHAWRDLDRDKEIRIDFEVTSKQIELQIADNGNATDDFIDAFQLIREGDLITAHMGLLKIIDLTKYFNMEVYSNGRRLDLNTGESSYAPDAKIGTRYVLRAVRPKTKGAERCYRPD
jgi:anti-sigma regulatory factor (Ser/Thr protein kinase)